MDELERIIFTNALTGGWRPAEQPFITAIITLRDHPEGTEYHAYVMHKNQADHDMHVEMGFYDGWSTVVEQLANLVECEVERRSSGATSSSPPLRVE